VYRSLSSDRLVVLKKFADRKVFVNEKEHLENIKQCGELKHVDLSSLPSLLPFDTTKFGRSHVLVFEEEGRLAFNRTLFLFGRNLILFLIAPVFGSLSARLVSLPYHSSTQIFVLSSRALLRVEGLSR
jgi:hypothetical protein